MMKKVAIYLAGIGTGGIESCTISQFEFIDKKRVEVDFLVDSSPVANFNVNKIHELNGKIVTCFHKVKSPFFKKILRPFAFVRAINKEQYDVVHLHISTPTALVYALLCKCLTKCRVIATSHAQGVSNRSKTFIKLCEFSAQHLAKYCDKCYADSHLAGIWMYGKADFEVMVNGIDTDCLKFNYAERLRIRKELNIDDNTILIGHVGRLSTDKNHFFIIKVFDFYTKLHPSSELVLIGKGELKNEIVERCQQRGILNKVHFVESVSSLAPYYSAMDIFIFPSLREGFGLVAIEAQSSSLPVLASDTVPKETEQTNIIQYLSLNESEKKWSEKIQQMLLTTEEREKVDIAQLKKNCNIRILSEQLVQLYNSI